MLVDVQQKRIVDFDIVLKTKPGVQGDWDGSSNGMEVRGLTRLIDRWKTNEKVGGIVHDNDSKATAAIAAAEWNVTQWYDPNHVLKQFARRWKSCQTGKLRGFYAKLLMWFRHLLRSDYSIDKKKEYWLNTLEHFQGHHEGCPREHPASGRGGRKLRITTDEQRHQMRAFLAETVELLARCLTGVHTNFNESCNALKVHYGDKNTSWKGSWSARMMCAMMQVNTPDDTNWRIELARLCRVRLSKNAVKQLDADWQKMLRLRCYRRTEEYRLRECRRRWEQKQKDLAKTAGIDDYHLPEEQFTGMVPLDRALQIDPTLADDQNDADLWDASGEFEMLVRNEMRFPPGEAPQDGEVLDQLDDELDEQDDEADDDEHVALLESLPEGTVLSDNCFVVAGMEGNTLHIVFRDDLSMGGGADGPESDDEDMEAPIVLDSDSDEEFPAFPIDEEMSPVLRGILARSSRAVPSQESFEGYRFNFELPGWECAHNPPDEILGTFEVEGETYYRVIYRDGTYGTLGSAYVILPPDPPLISRVPNYRTDPDFELEEEQPRPKRRRGQFF
jgi:hypothetical protein